MRILGITSVLMLFMVLFVVFDQSEAWWGRRSSSSSSSSSSSGRIKQTWDRAKNYATGFKNGAKEMHRAYKDMREANWKNSDKYYHARGNHDAAKHGTGGRHAAKIISDAREAYGWLKGDSAADRAADQRANEYGRNGGDPKKYLPPGMPKKYHKK